MPVFMKDERLSGSDAWPLDDASKSRSSQRHYLKIFHSPYIELLLVLASEK